MIICSCCTNVIEKCYICNMSFEEGRPIYCSRDIKGEHCHSGCYSPPTLAETVEVI